MRIQKTDAQVERQILTAMIISKDFLQGVKPIFKDEYLVTPFARRVAGWCLDYHDEYDKAPGEHIEDIFNHHKRNGLQEELSELIEKFLKSLSQEYEHSDGFNHDYMLDQAEKRFKARALQIATEDIKALLSTGDVFEAESILMAYKRPERPSSIGVYPLEDPHAIEHAFEAREKNVLVRLPGALGSTFGPIERTDFKAILAPEKRGKTWMLMQIAFWALQQHCNVAFFGMGDMPQDNFIRRMSIYMARRSDRERYCGEIIMPVLDCYWNQTDECERDQRACTFGVVESSDNGNNKMAFENAPDYEPCVYCLRATPKRYKGAHWYKKITTKRLTGDEVHQYATVFKKRAGKSRFKLITFPAGTANVKTIREHLNRWEIEEGFLPDVIISDYADIMGPENPRLEARHQHNERWLNLRALAAERHAAVITATQADAKSYDTRSIGMGNFTEDKRKIAHVTGMWTLNQTAKEKDEGIMRIGELAIREDDFDIRRHVTVLQCLKIGRPYLGSYI